MTKKQFKYLQDSVNTVLKSRDNRFKLVDFRLIFGTACHSLELKRFNKVTHMYLTIYVKSSEFRLIDEEGNYCNIDKETVQAYLYTMSAYKIFKKGGEVDAN